MIEFVKGNIFDSNPDILVCTVNCVGVMGAGIALECKNRFPAYYYDYKSKCLREELKPGEIDIFVNSYQKFKFKEHEPLVIISAATKDHWKNKSEIEWVASCIKNLEDAFININEWLHYNTIAIPALGCSNGKLDWKDVKLLFEKSKMNELSKRILVYEPN